MLGTLADYRYWHKALIVRNRPVVGILLAAGAIATALFQQLGFFLKTTSTDDRVAIPNVVCLRTDTDVGSIAVVAQDVAIDKDRFVASAALSGPVQYEALFADAVAIGTGCLVTICNR